MDVGVLTGAVWQTGARQAPDATLINAVTFLQYRNNPGLVAAAASAPYAGDVSPTYAYEILKAEHDALLVDVRCRAEWAFVGVPDLSVIGKQVAFIEWSVYPDMRRNESFLHELDRASGNSHDRPVFFLCRSGGRSQAAAIAATEAGYTRAYNIEDGFEGPLNAQSRRGTAGGWKAEGLPWGQS